MSGLPGDAGYMVLSIEEEEEEMDKVVKPEVYNPRDFTYKSSEADWVNGDTINKVVSE